MKKSTLHILLVLVIVACAQNAEHKYDAQYEIADHVSEEKIIEDLLEAPMLSESELSFFESRAVQKLEDYYEYLNLIQQSELDSTFKQQAIDMAKALFYNQQTIDSNLGYLSQIETALDSTIILDKALKLNRITTATPFKAANNNSYQMQLNHQVKHSKGKANRSAVVLLIQVRKKFGDQEKRVWEVFLKSIN